MTATDPAADMWTCRGLWWSGAIMLLAGLGCLGYQCFVWLESGVWHPMTVDTVFGMSDHQLGQTGWVGLDRIVDWVFRSVASWAVSIVLLAFGALANWIGYECAAQILAEMAKLQATRRHLARD